LEGKNAVDELLKIIATEKPAKIIVGLPKNLDNTLNPIEKNIGELIRLIGQKFPGIPVDRVDERFTSSLALQTMIAMNTKKSDRRKKENLDKISAAIILQSYIDANKNFKK
jgi:putative Holliday junction resolvase